MVVFCLRGHGGEEGRWRGGGGDQGDERDSLIAADWLDLKAAK